MTTEQMHVLADEQAGAGTPDLITTAEAAVLLGVCENTLLKLRKAGTLSPVEQVLANGAKRAYRVIYRRADILSLLEHRNRNARDAGRNIAFHDILTSALKSKGMTLTEAARASELTVGAIHLWSAGVNTPYRDNIERLAETVGEPKLLDVITTRLRRVRVTCRSCGNVRQEEPFRIRQYARERDPSVFSVDWETAEAIHLCTRCSAPGRIKTRRARIIKRPGGRKNLSTQGQALRDWVQANPAEAVRSIAAARTARQAWQDRDPRSKAYWRLGGLARKLDGTIALCVICHRILFKHASTVRQATDRGGLAIAKFHGACSRKWRKSTACRDWTAACNAARKEGKAPPPLPLPPPTAHRPVTGDSLAESYETTVRYFWQREGSGRASRDENGQVRSVAWLASDLKISRRTLHQRVERFLDLLPEESVATGTVKRWREVFLVLKLDSVDGA